MDLPRVISISSAAAHIECGEVSAVLAFISATVHRSILPSLSEALLAQALADREAIGATSTPEGVAFPHAIRAEIPPSAASVLILTLAKPIPWGSHSVGIVVALVGSTAEPWRHVRSLARVARVCAQPQSRERLMACASDVQLLELFTSECNNHE
ncbi:MAG: hypothetical protein EXS15_05645 [Phycisphaerales bacterium]|nr:hypothetical protein [Phycisphaerales bacterium]